MIDPSSSEREAAAPRTATKRRGRGAREVKKLKLPKGKNMGLLVASLAEFLNGVDEVFDEDDGVAGELSDDEAAEGVQGEREGQREGGGEEEREVSDGSAPGSGRVSQPCRHATDTTSTSISDDDLESVDSRTGKGSFRTAMERLLDTFRLRINR